MPNLSGTSSPASVPHERIKGKTKAKHKMIAELIAHGFPVKEVAKRVHLSESQIYHLLSDKDSFVNKEISRIISELFDENDLHLIDLYNKALGKLDNLLSTSDEKKQLQAIDRIIKIFLARSAKNPVSIQQYFGVDSPKEEVIDIDQMILQMRKDRGLTEFPFEDFTGMVSAVRKFRGLPELPDHNIEEIILKLITEPELPDLPDHNVSSHSTPEADTHSSQENSTPGNSAPDTPSQDVPSQESDGFLESIT